MKNEKMLCDFIKNEKWNSAISLLEKEFEQGENDVNLYVNIIYLLHHVLLECSYTMEEGDNYAALILKYYNESLNKYKSNVEYLFFIGYITHIAEWYFGIKEDEKPLSEQLSTQMQKKAFEIEPDNKLFKWAYFFTIRNNIYKDLAQDILNNNCQVEWLKERNFAGYFMLNRIKSSILFHE